MCSGHIHHLGAEFLWSGPTSGTRGSPGQHSGLGVTRLELSLHSQVSLGCALTRPRSDLSFLLCKVKVLGWRLLDRLSPGLQV